MVAVLLGALLTLGPAGAVRAHGEVRASQSARATDNADSPDVARAELAVTPELGLASEGRLRLGLSYQPALLVPADLAGNTEGLSGPIAHHAVVMHRVRATAEQALPRWRLRTGVTVSSGEALLVGAPTTGGASGVPTTGGPPDDPTTGLAPGDPVSTTGRVRQTAVEAVAGTTFEPTRRTTITLAGSVGRSGGSDAAARERLPLVESVGLGGTIGRRIAHRHVLGLDVMAQRTRVGEEPSGDAGYLRAGAAWSHDLTRRTSLRAGGGLAWTYERRAADTGSPHDTPSPVLPWVEGSAGVTAASETGPSGRLAVALEPAVDRFHGGVDLRPSVVGNVSWAPLRRWSFSAQGSMAALLGDEDGTPWGAPDTTTSSLGLSASHQLMEELRVTASAGSTWQRTRRADLPQFREDLVTLELVAGLFSL